MILELLGAYVAGMVTILALGYAVARTDTSDTQTHVYECVACNERYNTEHRAMAHAIDEHKAPDDAAARRLIEVSTHGPQ